MSSKNTSKGSKDAKSTQIEVQKKPKKTGGIDIETFMASSKIKKKITMLEDSSKEDNKDRLYPVDIDEVNDSKDVIIKILVHMVRYLVAELEEHKTYADGTYCSLKEFYRTNDNITDKINEVETMCQQLDKDADEE